jgi:predicted transposase YdaD
LHQYDSVLKSLLTGSQNSFLKHLIGAERGHWLNVELPRVTQHRVDLLFEVIRTLELILIELQSFNDPLLPLRMAEYALLVAQIYERFPALYVLYVGSERLSMASELVTPCLSCRFKIIDIRDWDAETLLQGKHPADAVLAILGSHSERPETIRRILQRIGKMKVEDRNAAFSKLLILAGMRNLAGEVQQEAKRMPIHYDIRDHEVFGPVIRQERAQALAEGLAEGKAEGLAEGEKAGRRQEAVSLLQRLIVTRFGAISTTTTRRLAKLTLPELEDLAIRFVTAKNVNDLFRR